MVVVASAMGPLFLARGHGRSEPLPCPYQGLADGVLAVGLVVPGVDVFGDFEAALVLPFFDELVKAV